MTSSKCRNFALFYQTDYIWLVTRLPCPPTPNPPFLPSPAGKRVTEEEVEEILESDNTTVLTQDLVVSPQTTFSSVVLRSYRLP